MSVLPIIDTNQALTLTPPVSSNGNSGTSVAQREKIKCMLAHLSLCWMLTHQKPSEKLVKVRSDLIDASGVVAQFPVPMAKYNLSIINEYLGYDFKQEREIEKSLKESFAPKLFTKLKKLMPQDPLYDPILKEMDSALKKVISKFPSMSTIEMKLNGPEQQDVLLEIAKVWIEIIESYSTLFSEEKKRSMISSIQEFPLKKYFASMKKYAQKTVILKEDRQHLCDWVRTIVATKKKFEKLIPPIGLKVGHSHGITFEITKGDKHYGYVYATMHHLNEIPELNRVLEISFQTIKKLFECAIIGTEVGLPNEPKSKSLEGTLLFYSSQLGLANLGLDERDYEYPAHFAVADMSNPWYTTFNKPVEPKTVVPIDHMGELVKFVKGAKDENTLLRTKMIALYTGIVQYGWAATLAGEAMRHRSPMHLAIDAKRNFTMTENMDSLLKAADTVGLENHEPPPKCFFAVGFSHLIPTETNPLSIVELLAQKGWTVKMPPEIIDAQFPPSSHILTEEEAQGLEQLQLTTHVNPLFHYQTE